MADASVVIIISLFRRRISYETVWKKLKSMRRKSFLKYYTIRCHHKRSPLYTSCNIIMSVHKWQTCSASEECLRYNLFVQTRKIRSNLCRHVHKRLHIILRNEHFSFLNSAATSRDPHPRVRRRNASDLNTAVIATAVTLMCNLVESGILTVSSRTAAVTPKNVASCRGMPTS